MNVWSKIKKNNRTINKPRNRTTEQYNNRMTKKMEWNKIKWWIENQISDTERQTDRMTDKMTDGAIYGWTDRQRKKTDR